MAPPTYIKGIGALGTGRYQFQDHLDGINPPGSDNFRHDATMIDMNPPVISGATTVQASFQNVAAFIAAQANVGEGFATIQDGYNTWHNANGQINFDPTVPSLDTLLNPIFASIIAFQASVYAGSGSPPPVLPGYERLQFGGILVIKAGTFIVKKTILVPPGITIIGEGYGTKIINATNLTLSPLPPVPQATFTITGATNASPIQITTSAPIPNLATGDILNIVGVLGNTAANSNSTPIQSNQPWHAPWTITITGSNTFTLNGSTGNGGYSGGGTVSLIKPIFRILADPNRTVNDAAIDVSGNYFGFERETRIMNLTIADNFVEPTILGDSFYYKQPQNATTATGGNPPGLIQQESGSSLVLEQVLLIGRAATSSWTGSAIFLDTTTPPTPAGTLLRVNNCFLDGFSIPIIWCGRGGGNDYLEITNCKIRGYGSYNGNASAAVSNSLILVNDTTSKITNNILYGAGLNIIGGAFVNGTLASAPTKQARGKLTVATNDFVIDKASNSTNSTFSPIQVNGGVSSSYLSYLAYGNNFQDLFDVNVDGTEALQISSSGLAATTFAGGATFTSGASAIFDSGSALTLNSGSTAHISGTAVLESGSSLEVSSGSTFFTDAGSNALFSGTVGFQPGSSVQFESNLEMTTSTTLQMDSGSNLHLLAGSTATLSGSATITSPGAGIIISDSGNPTFASTRVRNIVQPLISGGITSATFFASYIQDNGSGNAFTIPLTKLINGARVTEITIPMQIATIHTPAVPSSFIFIQVLGGAGHPTGVTQIGTATGPVSTSGPGNFIQLIVPGGGVFIDDSNYFYYLLCLAESGSGSTSIDWFSPVLLFDKIATVGQF